MINHKMKKIIVIYRAIIKRIIKRKITFKIYMISNLRFLKKIFLQYIVFIPKDNPQKIKEPPKKLLYI